MKTMLKTATACLLIGLAAVSTAAPPTQTVYKCIQGGKTVYTDAPCLNGKEVDASPTRGMDSSTGRLQRGADATRDIQREAIADALKPLTGMNREQFDRAGRRTKLSAAAQQECKALDQSIPVTREPKELLGQRRRYREIGCE